MPIADSETKRLTSLIESRKAKLEKGAFKNDSEREDLEKEVSKLKAAKYKRRAELEEQKAGGELEVQKTSRARDLPLAIIKDPMQEMVAALQEKEAREQADPLLAEARQIEEEKRAEFDRASQQVKHFMEWQKKVDQDYNKRKSSSARITNASLKRKAEAMNEAKFAPRKQEAAQQLEAAKRELKAAQDALNEASKDRKEFEFLQEGNQSSTTSFKPVD